jgi:hypothetical protein
VHEGSDDEDDMSFKFNDLSFYFMFWIRCLFVSLSFNDLCLLLVFGW